MRIRLRCCFCLVLLQGSGLPHQCAHWFAMTCRRRGRGYVCKDVSAMDTLGRGRGLPRRGAAAPLLAMTCRRRWRERRCKGAARNDMQRLAMCQRLQGRSTRQIRRPLQIRPAAPSCTRSSATIFCMSLRGAKRRGNPFSLRQHKAKRNYSRRIRRSCGFALSIANLLSFPAGTRIATPVCALVRNDMQRLAMCQRLQGRSTRQIRIKISPVSRKNRRRCGGAGRWRSPKE